MDLEEAADRLYGVPPDEFVAARADLERRAREAGDVVLARAIAGLRKPTVSAWAVNQVARERPEELGELLELGERLRRAWHDQDAGALAELTGRRSHVAGRLARLVRDTAAERSRPLSSAALNEVEQTLDAATVDAEAAAQVRRGRLVRTLSYSGFAPAPVTSVRPPAGRAPKTGAKRTAGPGAKAGAGGEAGERGDAGERREAERERRREALREAATAAERAAAEAEGDHAQWQAELTRAEEEYEEQARLVGGLESRLAAARDRLAAVERRLGVIRRDEGRARREAVALRRRADQARRALGE